MQIDLDQARRRAKELHRAARAGDPESLARLPRRHDPVVLADAQLAVARELGFASWPKLVAAVGRWHPAAYDEVEWSQVRRATFVCFLQDSDHVVIPEDGLPSDDIHDGENVMLDSALRIPLERAAFRRQGTHVFALAEARSHVAIWVDGNRYDGRRPHRNHAYWWTGPATDVDDPLVQLAQQARRWLTPEQFRADARRILDPSYLSATTPQGGCGDSGTDEDWRGGRHMITDAIDSDGTFLDVGCANGYLVECIADWCADRGVHVEPYGVDISPALITRAKERLPQWTERFWVGDALTWQAPRTFDVVHALLGDAVMPHERPQMIENLLRAVTPGGRLVLSHYAPRPSPREIVTALNYTVDGETSNPDVPGRLGQPSCWITKRP